MNKIILTLALFSISLVSHAQYSTYQCMDMRGQHSYWSVASNSCACNYPYVTTPAGSNCVTQEQYCRDSFGINSTWDSSVNHCICLWNTVLNGDGTQCVSKQSAVIPTSTPVVTLKSTSSQVYIFHRTLKQGMSGEDVKYVQSYLKVSPTGYFGTLTKKSVIQFQKLHNVYPQSGIVGPLTQYFLK